MKKVCHVISGYYRTDARVFQRQCKSLAKGGFEVCLLTNDGQPNELIEGIKVYATDKYWNNRLKVLLFANSQFIKKAIEINADIYQLHSPELIPLGLKLKKLGKIVVYDAHEDMPSHILEKEWIPFLFRRVVSILIAKYMKNALSRYDEIISPHSHVVKYLKKISNNVNLIANFPLVNTDYKFDYNDYKKNENLMCYSGTVYSYSNQEAILDAMSKIQNVEYQIAGYIDPNHLENLSNHTSFKKVKFLGRIPWNDLPVFYQNSILGLVIYDYKLNLGYKLGSYGTNKLFEYMEAGLPFICTDYDLWKEIVDKYDCGICVEPNNSKQIEEAVLFLINNKEKAYQMGQNGRKAVLLEYNWKTQEREYLRIFKKYDK